MCDSGDEPSRRRIVTTHDSVIERRCSPDRSSIDPVTTSSPRLAEAFSSPSLWCSAGVSCRMLGSDSMADGCGDMTSASVVAAVDADESLRSLSAPPAPDTGVPGASSSSAMAVPPPTPVLASLGGSHKLLGGRATGQRGYVFGAGSRRCAVRIAPGRRGRGALAVAVHPRELERGHAFLSPPLATCGFASTPPSPSAASAAVPSTAAEAGTSAMGRDVRRRLRRASPHHKKESPQI